MAQDRSASSWIRRLTPKLWTCLREGYRVQDARADGVAGLVVAVVALPLALAVGIASVPEGVAIREHLVPPALGLITAVVGGLLLSLLGGARTQIGGPSGVSIAVLYAICAEHGYVGLVTATLMAGVILIIMGVSGLGALVKYIPYPVTAGFTTGGAVIIATTQVKEFCGLRIESIPADWTGKVQAYAQHAGSVDARTLAVGLGTLLLVIGLKKVAPRAPGLLIGVLVAAGAVWALGWGAGAGGSGGVATIASRFGGLGGAGSPLGLGRGPALSLEMVRDLVPEATTIAILVSIETLLSAVVADGMTGTRHRPDQELVGLGVANIVTSLVGGLPVTGGASRTIANVRAGARTPVAGIVHALVIGVGVLAAGGVLGRLPLPALSAVLFVVAWGMADLSRFRALLRTPRGDVAVLLTTFGLTVFVGMHIAVGVGMVLAAMLFVQRMSELSQVSAITSDSSEAGDTPASRTLESKDPAALTRRAIPAGVEVFEVSGPVFFAVADRLKDTLRQVSGTPKVFVLRLRRVPHIDATGLHALSELHQKCKRTGAVLLLGGVHAQPMFELVRTGLDRQIGMENIFETLEEALERARVIVGEAPLAGAANPPAPPLSSDDRPGG